MPPVETIQPKDEQNYERIENIIDQNDADKVHSETVGTGKLEVGDRTDEVSGDAYDGTEATIVKNEAAKEAETFVPSGDNDYSQNLGGANAENATTNPVEANPTGQAAADAGEMSISEAPSSGSDVAGDFGFN